MNPILAFGLHILGLIALEVLLLGIFGKVRQSKEKANYLYVEISKDAGIEPVLSCRGPNGRLWSEE